MRYRSVVLTIAFVALAVACGGADDDTSRDMANIVREFGGLA